MDPQVLVILIVAGYVAGLAAAIGWPYLNSRLQNPGLPFDWRYATWQIIGGVLGFVPTILAADSAGQFAEFAASGLVGVVLAAVAGYGAARAGREAQKTNAARVARKNGGA